MKTVNKTICILWILFYNILFGQTSLFNLSSITGSAGLNTEQLARYNVLIASESYTSINFITTGNVLTMADSGKININLPFILSGNIQLNVESSTYTNDSNFVWTGSFIADSLSARSYQYAKLTIMKNEGMFIGHFTFDNKSYEFADLTGGVQVLCQSKMLAGAGTGCGESLVNNNSSVVGSKPGENPCKNFTTKVLVLYTDQTLQSFSDINGVANLALQQLNDIWANSKIFNTLILASVKKITFNQNVTSDPLFDVTTLSNNSSVQALRSQFKADIVVLLVKDVYTFGGGTIFGVAKEIEANSSGAFCISQVNAATSGRFTFAHEIAYLYGARHDLDPSPSNGRGFIFQTGCNWFGFNCSTRKTLMVSPLGQNESRIDRVSNPSVNFMSKPTGNSFHNNADQITSKLEFVANFFADIVPKHGFLNGTRVFCSFSLYNITICDDPALFDYQWYSSSNSINWTAVGTNVPSFSISQPAFVKCVVTLKTSPFPVIYNFYVPPIKCNETVSRIGLPWRNISGSQTGTQSGKLMSAANVKIGDKPESVSLSIYPNPNNGDFTLDFYSEEQTNVKIVIADNMGRELEVVKDIQALSGFNQWNIKTISKLKHGMYFIKILGLQKPLVRTFVID